MGDIARGRLVEERKQWRKEHPIGFYARPGKKKDGSTDLMNWEAGIPGKKGTIWEGGVFKLRLIYPEDFPSSPPKVQFVPPLFHPNVYPSGTVCLSILNADQGWNPTVTLKAILLGIQDLLDTPNPNSPANGDAIRLFQSNIEKYKKRVQVEVQNNPP